MIERDLHIRFVKNPLLMKMEIFLLCRIYPSVYAGCIMARFRIATRKLSVKNPPECRGKLSIDGFRQRREQTATIDRSSAL
jgi:hypothetical protein